MEVGVYVDGYTLYYGGRHCCGRGSPGWRWLDVRALVMSVVAGRQDWPGARIARVVYCTARVDAATNPSAHADQDVYLKALLASRSVDWIEYGTYVARAKKSLLATEDPRTRRPIVQSSAWPVMVQDAQGGDVRDARFMVQYLHLEEKGSDVNLASHLLVDVLDGVVDAAIVVSNDSDLAFPVRTTKQRVPVGLVNPRPTLFAGDLTGDRHYGVGGHWWHRLSDAQYRAHQLPDPAGTFTKPMSW
jgi:hypothetical protein